MHFEGMFICRHPIPSAGRSKGKGTSCGNCREGKGGCAPLSPHYVVVFNKANGVRTRFEAAMEYLKTPNLPASVVDLLTDEVTRFMALLVSRVPDSLSLYRLRISNISCSFLQVFPLVSNKRDTAVERSAVRLIEERVANDRAVWQAVWKRRYFWTERPDGLCHYNGEEFPGEKASTRALLFKGHGDVNGEPRCPAYHGKDQGQVADDNVLVVLSDSEASASSRSLTPTPGPKTRGHKGKGKSKARGKKDKDSSSEDSEMEIEPVHVDFDAMD
jgi:hypothetical protein